MSGPVNPNRLRSALYALAGLLVPGGVPFGMIDREHPAAEPAEPEA